MKRLVLLLFATIAFSLSFSQEIEYQNSGIKITASVSDASSNLIYYMVAIPVDKIELAISIFPRVNGCMLMDGKFVFNSDVVCPDMPTIRELMVIVS